MYAANVIAENMYSQSDKEGKQCALLDKITEHQTDASVIPNTKGYIRTS